MEDYLNLFIEESKEHLQLLNENLLEFEKNLNNKAYVNEMFRSAHTLKGMAGTMGFEKTAKLTHHMENIMDDIRHNKLQATENIVDLLFECLDSLESLIDEITSSQQENADIKIILEKIKNIENKSEHKNSENVNANTKSIELTSFEKELAKQAVEDGQKLIKIECFLVEDCALKSIRYNMVIKHIETLAEIIKTNPDFQDIEPDEISNRAEFIVLTEAEPDDFVNIQKKVSEVEEIVATIFIINEEKPTPTKEEVEQEIKVVEKEQKTKNEVKQKNQQNSKSIRVSLDKIEKIMSLFEEFIVEKARLSSISQDIKDIELAKSLERINRYSGEMQNAVLSMRMLPVDAVFNRFPRMVRNLAKELDKNIELIVSGSETELDRMMIDELGDPLVHLIRNSLDHGIESPEERKKTAKSEVGTIRLEAFHSGNKAVIQISDDGKGIDSEIIRDKAIKNGVLTDEEASKLTKHQIVQYIFASGFSTAKKVTGLSGRGVGLDVVKSKIEALGGSVSVETEVGHGSTFTINLPLTLSIIQTLVVKSGVQNVVIPLSNIVETTYIKDTDIKILSNEPIIHFRGEVLPVKTVNDLFGSQFSDHSVQSTNPTIIIRVGEKTFALVVSELIGQQEIVLKNLEGLLEGIKHVSGATILGDGSIAFVIDCNSFIK